MEYFVLNLISMRIFSDLHSVRQHNQLGGIIEHHAHSLVTQLVPKTIFVAVVDPLAHPEHWIRRRITVFIPQVCQVTLQLRAKQIRQLLVQHFQVHFLIDAGGWHHPGSGDGVMQVVLQERRLVVGFILNK